MNITESDKLQRRIVQKKKSLDLAKNLRSYIEQNCSYDTRMLKRIDRQLNCSNMMFLLEDGSLVTHFCGQKTCYVCNRIRMTKFIKKYLNGIKSEINKYFVTLTVKNPNEDHLHSKVHQFYTFFQNSYLKKHPRYKYLNKRIKMIRSFEFTLNSKARTYHIHLHILLAGELEEEIREYGELLITYWKKYFNEEGEVSDDAQYLEKLKKGEIENFKYMTKLDDINNDNLSMLYNMLEALTGRRLFMAKNIKVAKNNTKDEVIVNTEEEFEEQNNKVLESEMEYINGKKVVKRFYFNEKMMNYLDSERRNKLLSNAQQQKIPEIINEKRNFYNVSRYFNNMSI